MKKKNYFYQKAVTLVVLSNIFLVFCICLMVYAKGSQKKEGEYDKLNVEEILKMASIESPMSQTELQNKFSSMYNVIEGTSTITVISEEYLNNYWKKNYDEEVAKSLSIDEVLYIIQDSIRIYDEYDTIIMLGYECESENSEIENRFPSISYREINSKDNIEDIYDIIMYRITALSSPNALIEKDSVYYIAGYESENNRKFLDEMIGSTISFTNLDEWVDFFEIDMEKNIIILHTKDGNQNVYQGE